MFKNTYCINIINKLEKELQTNITDEILLQNLNILHTNPLTFTAVENNSKLSFNYSKFYE
jgi:hypothetical protein